MIIKIKIFKNPSLVELESRINDWLESTPSITAVTNMQYSQNFEDVMHAQKVGNNGELVPAITSNVKTNVCLILYTI